MLLIFDEELKQDISFLIGQSVDIVVEFCKICLEFLQSGSNKRLFGGASKVLKVDVEVVGRGVQGLSYFFTESALHKISALDFLDSCMLLGFAPAASEILQKFYLQYCALIRDLEKASDFSLLSYSDLAWRLDVEIGKRALRNYAKPKLTIRLDLSKPSVAGEHPPVEPHYFEADLESVQAICKQLEAALQASKSEHARRMQRNVK